MKIIDNIPVFGPPQENAVEQMKNCLKTAERGCLMADHHLGYSVPVGGVVVYDGYISPSGVGFDIACGNKAVLTNITYDNVLEIGIKNVMDSIMRNISFGVGQRNRTIVEHKLYDDEAWEIPAVKPLKEEARKQLGTIGSGNHYVDVFVDEKNRIWVGVHFGSRGLGHKIASHYIKEGGGTDGMFVDPVVLDVDTELGKEYIAAMNLAGRYAYAGRDWVCETVVKKALYGEIVQEIHNHHNYAWFEHGKWVVRKGATPAHPGQLGFVGGSMGENSVILKGVEHEECQHTAYSTVHGAGRVLSRRQAAGRVKYSKGKKIRLSEGQISNEMMMEWVNKAGVELRGAGVDESPHCYKRLEEVLQYHKNTIEIIHTLKPIGVAMAGEDIFDPYKD
jgi:tRNA-splicing ligase RtcB